MRRLRAPAGRHVGSKTLSPQNKAPEGSYPVGRHSAAVLANVALPGTPPLGLYSCFSVGYYQYAAPLGLKEYGFA